MKRSAVVLVAVLALIASGCVAGSPRFLVAGAGPTALGVVLYAVAAAYEARGPQRAVTAQAPTAHPAEAGARATAAGVDSHPVTAGPSGATYSASPNRDHPRGQPPPPGVDCRSQPVWRRFIDSYDCHAGRWNR